MLENMAHNWWMLLIRGIVAILFGIIALLNPGIAIASLVLLWGAYALADGVFAVISGFTHRQTNPNWWVVSLEGVVGIVAGVLTFLWPEITAVALLYIVAAWAVITGVMEIVAAIHLRKEISGEFWLGLSGVLSILVGVYLVLNPGPGLVALLWVVASYAIIFGVSLIFLSFRVRGMAGGQSGSPQAA